MLRPSSKGASDAQGIELLRKMMSPRAIRRGHAGDLPAVAQLLESEGLPGADLASAHQFQTWLLEEQGSLLGVVGLERFGHEALLRSLAVAPDHRKRGLGRQLVARLEQDADAEGIQRLVLLTETAHAFFRDLGYAVIDRRRVSDEVRQSAEFRSLCPASAICMSKTLRNA